VVVDPGQPVRVTYNGVVIKGIDVPNDDEVGGFSLDHRRRRKRALTSHLSMEAATTSIRD
jgi:hypothetical protein